MWTTEQDLLEIDGSVDVVVYKNDDNGYAVLELDCSGSLVTVVGELGNVEAGEELHVTGKYTTHAKYGSQFRAYMCERRLPATAAAIQKYLSSGIIKGIGPGLAKRIVEKFGDDTLLLIEKNPAILSEVRGISAAKAEELGEEFKRVFGVRSLMLYLARYAVPVSISIAVWKRWGNISVDIINENPYELCSPGVDMGFVPVDAIASELGISESSIYRITAGITHVLTSNLNSGHTLLPLDRLCTMSCRLLRIEEALFHKVLGDMLEKEAVVLYKKRERSFIYLKALYVAETYIAGRLAVMKSCFPDAGMSYDAALDLVEEETGIHYESLQRKAISLALSQGFLILTGGPGTGKTTTLNAIISLFEQRGDKVLLAAPTGRAAKRMSELTGYDAKTIHRLLEVSYAENGMPKFQRNETNPLDCSVVIIDEMSMVDALLFESLLRALKLSCRLIMVGDSDQLPSVGAGNVLKDMIDSNTLPVVELKEIFRQAAESCIITNAHKIVRGQMPDLSQKNKDFFFIQRLDERAACDTVVELCKSRLPQSYGFSPLSDIQVMSPCRKGELGVIELNKCLQQALNSNEDNERKEMKYYDSIFREGDKVMQIKNNYDIIWDKNGEHGSGVFNGDIGIIQMIDKPSGVLMIDFDGRTVSYNADMLSELEHAYAITVHKSQGSEFDAVILPLLSGYDKLYFRNLLYTAVTRAKRMLIIVGSKNRVEFMVRNDRKTLRYTGLKSMLQKEVAP